MVNAFKIKAKQSIYKNICCLDKVFKETKVVNIYFSPGQVEGPAILSGSICSWFPVRWSTFKCANRPRFNILSPVMLLKDKSKTCGEKNNVKLFDHHNILSDICFNHLRAEYDHNLKQTHLQSLEFFSMNLKVMEAVQ